MATVVTGAAGFIGRHVVDKLLSRGEAVVGIDRRPIPARPGLAVLTADLTSGDERVRGALADADRVLHLAALPGVRDQSAHQRQRDNVSATRTVLEAVPTGTPLVFTSSSSVYGGCRSGRPSAEDDPLHPQGGYAHSKLAAEALCRSRLAAGGQVAIVRPFTVAGPGQRPDMAIAKWIAAAVHGGPVRLFGGPERTRDITDVDQVARALVELADRETCGTVNLGTGAGRTLAELVAAVSVVIDVELPRIEVVPAHPADVPDTLADTRRLRRALGWVPRTDLVGLVARQVAATRAPAPSRPVVAEPATLVVPELVGRR